MPDATTLSMVRSEWGPCKIVQTMCKDDQMWQSPDRLSSRDRKAIEKPQPNAIHVLTGGYGEKADAGRIRIDEAARERSGFCF